MTGSFCASRRAFLLATASMPAWLRLIRQGGIVLRIHLIDDGSVPDVAAGVRLSITEAQRAAQLLGSSISLDDEGEVAIVAAAELPALPDDVVVINAALPAERIGTHHARLFHIAETAQTQSELWSADLERFGAGQLNARYRHMYNTGMTSLAWAGWFAVKAAWEAALRARSTDPADIAAYLMSGAFDGHKGRPLRFHPTSRVLQ